MSIGKPCPDDLGFLIRGLVEERNSQPNFKRFQLPMLFSSMDYIAPV
jgi:hypothetical protein